MWHVAEFQPSELINLAVQIEQEGAKLYGTLAAKTQNSKSKELLEWLGTEEVKHQEIFSKLGSGMEAISPSEQYFGEYFDYLKSSVDTHLFNDQEYLEQQVAAAKSELDIVRLASTFEKDTILFFSSFRRMISAKNQKMMEDIIEEEHRHLAKLAAIRQEIVRG